MATELTITPEPSEKEAAVIAAAVEMLLAAEGAEVPLTRVSKWRRAAPWRAATRPRPVAQFPKGMEPSLAWRLSGRAGRPYGR